MTISRVSDQTSLLNIVAQYQSLQARQTELQQQISSGEKYQYAGDDPSAAATVLDLNTELAQVQQRVTTLGQAQDFANNTDTVLSNANSIVQQAQELAVEAGDTTLTSSDRQAIASQVDGLLNSLVTLGSQQYDGRNVLSGSQTGQAAFSTTTDAQGQITAVTYQGDGAQMQVECAPGQTVAYNIPGGSPAGSGQFGLLQDPDAGVDVFQTLIQFRDNVVADPSCLSDINQQLQAAQAHIGLGQAMLASSETTLNNAVSLQKSTQTQIQADVNNIDGTDLASAATDLASLQNAYQAALAVGAKVSQTSLLNYLT